MPSKFRTNYLPEIFALGLNESKPRMVTVNLTSRCNQRCVYCEIGVNPAPVKKDVLTKEDLFWILDEMELNKIRKISLCGGEPFLFKGLIDVVDYAGLKNIRCSITTNGMSAYLLEAEDLKVLQENKTEINISIDSFDENIQSTTRGTPTALANALKSVDKLHKNGIPVTVLTAISKYNYSELYDFLRTAYDKGIRQVLFQPIIYYSNFPERQAIDGKAQLNVGAAQLDVLMEELNKILAFEKKHKIKTNVYRILPWIRHYLETAASPEKKWFFKDVLSKFYCREIYAIIDISYDGGIQPCGLSQASTTIFENRETGLLNQWLQATAEIKKDLLAENYYTICNGCCHHFSRNMLASLLKHPLQNRVALARMVPLMASRIQSRILKSF